MKLVFSWRLVCELLQDGVSHEIYSIIHDGISIFIDDFVALMKYPFSGRPCLDTLLVTAWCAVQE